MDPTLQKAGPSCLFSLFLITRVVKRLQHIMGCPMDMQCCRLCWLSFRPRSVVCVAPT